MRHWNRLVSQVTLEFVGSLEMELLRRRVQAGRVDRQHSWPSFEVVPELISAKPEDVISPAEGHIYCCQAGLCVGLHDFSPWYRYSCVTEVTVRVAPGPPVHDSMI